MNNQHIRKNIFVFLNKGPLIRCTECTLICKWGKKKFYDYINFHQNPMCHVCIRNKFNCKVT